MERNTWPGEAKVRGLRRATGCGRFRVALQFKFRGCNRCRGCGVDRQIPFTEGQLGAKVHPVPREIRGERAESPVLPPSTGVGPFPFIKRKNFRFSLLFVFNGISDFRWRKGRVFAAVTLMAGRGTRFTVAQLEAKELPAPVKKYPGGDSKVQSLQRATGFGLQLYR